MLKFKHNFGDSTTHFFLNFANFNTQRKTLFDKIATIDANVLTENEDSIVNALLFGKPNCENSVNYQLRDLIMLIKNCTLHLFFNFFCIYQDYMIHTPGILFNVCLFYLISIFV